MSNTLTIHELRERLAILQERILTSNEGTPQRASALLHAEAVEAEITKALSRPLIGTVYLDPTNGNTYRLTGYYRAFNYGTEEYTSEEPGYMRYTNGGSGSADKLPAGAFAIWVPSVN